MKNPNEVYNTMTAPQKVLYLAMLQHTRRRYAREGFWLGVGLTTALALALGFGAAALMH